MYICIHIYIYIYIYIEREIDTHIQISLSLSLDVYIYIYIYTYVYIHPYIHIHTYDNSSCYHYHYHHYYFLASSRSGSLAPDRVRRGPDDHRALGWHDPWAREMSLFWGAHRTFHLVTTNEQTSHTPWTSQTPLFCFTKSKEVWVMACIPPSRSWGGRKTARRKFCSRSAKITQYRCWRYIFRLDKGGVTRTFSHRFGFLRPHDEGPSSSRLLRWHSLTFELTYGMLFNKTISYLS